MKKLKYIFITVAATLMLSFGLGATPALALAGCSSNNPTAKQAIQGGINKAAGVDQDCTTPAGSDKTLENIIRTILNLISLVVGILAVIMIIVSGIRFILSGGKEESIKSAKNTLVYAIIGLVIVALAQVIVHLVLTETANQIVSPASQKQGG